MLFEEQLLRQPIEVVRNIVQGIYARNHAAAEHNIYG